MANEGLIFPKLNERQQYLSADQNPFKEQNKKESQAAFKVLNKKTKSFEVAYRLDEKQIK
jgi:hypothetical protein